MGVGGDKNSRFVLKPLVWLDFEGPDPDCNEGAIWYEIKAGVETSGCEDQSRFHKHFPPEDF